MDKNETRKLAPIHSVFGILAPPIAVAFAIYWHTAFGVPVRDFDIVLLVVFYSISLIGIEVGYHRCFSHRAFEVSPNGARLLLVMGSIAYQGALFWWVSTHRQHHAKTDREGDPHSPNLHDGTLTSRIKAAIWAHYLWAMFHEKPSETRKVPPVFDLLKRREIWTLERYYQWIAIAGLILPGVIGLMYEPSLQSFISGVLWGGLIRVFAASNAFMLLNSCGHLVGTRPYAAQGSRNNGILALFTFGQGWHNNHHAFPRAACLWLRPWQFDPGYLIIRLMMILGLAHSPQFAQEQSRNGINEYEVSHD